MMLAVALAALLSLAAALPAPSRTHARPGRHRGLPAVYAPLMGYTRPEHRRLSRTYRAYVRAIESAEQLLSIRIARVAHA